MNKKTILCLTDYYVPGYKSGGPLRSIFNLTEHIGDTINILILTRDRDATDKISYQNIIHNQWNTVNKASVYYTLPGFKGFIEIFKIIKHTEFDTLYLNSFFSPKFTLLPLLIRAFRIKNFRTIIIAPRGEFSQGALKFSALKKKLFKFFIRFFKIYDNLLWQASSNHEKIDIQRELHIPNNSIFIAPDCYPLNAHKKIHFTHKKYEKGILDLIFISRICPKKNLDYALMRLSESKSRIRFNIYGPIRDIKYWNYCKLLISKLPSNISTTYHGQIEHKHIYLAFSRADLFVFPTHGENYGHVVLESLSAGTPVLISDLTPWQQTSDMSITVRNLDDYKSWTFFIDQFAELDNNEKVTSRHNAIKTSEKYMLNSSVTKLNLNLFLNN